MVINKGQKKEDNGFEQEEKLFRLTEQWVMASPQLINLRKTISEEKLYAVVLNTIFNSEVQSEARILLGKIEKISEPQTTEAELEENIKFVPSSRTYFKNTIEAALTSETINANASGYENKEQLKTYRTLAAQYCGSPKYGTGS